MNHFWAYIHLYRVWLHSIAWQKIARFVSIGIKTTAHTKSVCIFIIYSYTKFNMPKSNGSLLTAIKPEAKYRALFCFVFLQKISFKTEVR
jgi:hypothetical protein